MAEQEQGFRVERAELNGDMVDVEVRWPHDDQARRVRAVRNDESAGARIMLTVRDWAELVAALEPILSAWTDQQRDRLLDALVADGPDGLSEAADRLRRELDEDG